MAEVFFILFSPVFVNKKYYYIVAIGITLKYLIIGLLLQTSEIFFPVIFMMVLALVAYINLNRFISYIEAINDSYNKQFETSLSSGIDIMNHTIKNEITKIQYLSNRMKELASNLDNDGVNQVIISIQLATNHMLNMSSRLQAKTGEIVLQEETHNLNSILESAITMIEPILQKNHVQCALELNIEVNMMCDRLQLQEALMNIMMNAVESMELNGGIVTIRLYKVMKDVVIEIEDTGCGIPSDIRSRVFEPFFTTRSTLNNHGLGLSYSNNVIEKHGGTIRIQSEVNIGTKVFFCLPQHRFVQTQKTESEGGRTSSEQDKSIAG
jgi:two-component system sporulation sensor kinase B